MELILWLVAVALGIWGVVRILQGAFLMGIILVILAFLVGPGGVSIFHP